MEPKEGEAKTPFQELLRTVNQFKMPEITFPLPKFDVADIPTIEETHSYESSAELVKRLAARIKAWQSKLPANTQPAIVAFADSGVAINVESIGSEGHHGLVIQGFMGDSECLLLLHQSAVRLLCFIEKAQPDEPKKIGFTIEGKSV